jgi:hypothetical protein
MKYIFIVTFMILLSSICRAESSPFVPQPIPEPTTPFIVDEYSSGISYKDEKVRLKAAAEQIKDYQNQFNDMHVPIIFFGEKCSALKRANRVKNYLLKTEGIESNRIVTFYGGNEKSWSVRIYLIPVRMTEPEPNTDLIKGQDCQVI